MTLSLKKISVFLFSIILSNNVFSAESFKMCWSIYAGWMPWAYASESGIIDKWAKKYDIEIDVVQINDYIEPINQYTSGEFDACTMTNMDALTIPAAGGVDSTMLIVGDYSNGNDAIILKGKDKLEDIKGQQVNLVELSVSHYFLARALESVGMSEKDVKVINTSDADMTSIFGTKSVTSVVTWNPMASDILKMPKANSVYDSSAIPGEIIDGLVANTAVLKKHPELGKALVGAWYETLEKMQGDSKEAKAIRSKMAEAAATDLAGYDAQLAQTFLFYSPADAVKFVKDKQLLTTSTYVSEFSFKHGLLGEGAPDASFIGVEMPAGVYGNPKNIKLRFNKSFAEMAAEGKL